jgi:hypothetical protein
VEQVQKLRSGSNLSGGSFPGSSMGSQLAHVTGRNRSASDTGSTTPAFRRCNSVVVQTQVYQHTDSTGHRHSLDLQRTETATK